MNGKDFEVKTIDGTKQRILKRGLAMSKLKVSDEAYVWFRDEYLGNLDQDSLNKILDGWISHNTPERVSDPRVSELMHLGMEWRKAQVTYNEREEELKILKTVGAVKLGSMNDCDSMKLWWVFEGSPSEDQILKQLSRHYAHAHGTSWTSAYDCTGKWFAGPASIRFHGRNKVLVTQQWYIDC